MASLDIALKKPSVQIVLDIVEGRVELVAERDLIELLTNGSMKPFADAVCLRRFHLGSGVVNVIDG